MEPWNDDEVEGLRELLKFKNEIKAYAEYHYAKRIVVAKWRGLIIGTASLLGAFILLKDKAEGGMKWLLGYLAGN